MGLFSGKIGKHGFRCFFYPKVRQDVFPDKQQSLNGHFSGLYNQMHNREAKLIYFGSRFSI